MAEDPTYDVPPVQMGSDAHLTSDAGGLLFTWASFPGGAVLQPHVHDRPTFACILNGGFDLRFSSPGLRGRDYPCTPGTIFSEPPEETHANHVFDGGAEVVVIQPDPASEMLVSFDGLLDRVNYFRHGRIEGLARRLARELRDPDNLSLLAAQALALDMLVEAVRIDRTERSAPPEPAWMRKAHELVHDRFRERLTIADIAAELGVRPGSLASHFRARHKVPLGTYVRRLRVQWAADRLVGSEDSISSIALRAGFTDQAHFTRVFKRETGWTPARYRRGRRS